MKHIYRFLCLFLLSNVVTADSHILTLEQLRQANIVGAFGQKLGAVVGNPDAPHDKTKNGGLSYPFKPENPYPALQHYYVVATPASKTIYAIRMIGKVINCYEEKNVLQVVLKQKYPALEFVESHGHYEYRQFIDQDRGRMITLQCDDSFLEVLYKDFELGKQVLQERASLVDKSNF